MVTTRSGKRSAAAPAAGQPASAKRPATNHAKLRKYSGTLNLYKSWGARPPVLGQRAQIIKEEFTSSLIETREQLKQLASKIRTYGFSGSMGGKGSRREFKHPLVEASKKGSINFSTEVLALAVFSQRMREPQILSISAVGAELRVTCAASGPDRSTIDSSSSQEWVSFAAAVVPRPASSVGSPTASFSGEQCHLV